MTGGNRGIGRTIVDRFAAEGAEVMVVGRDEEAIHATLADVSVAGGKAWGHPADMTKDDDLAGHRLRGHGALAQRSTCS